jgi:hypothetical protein
MGLCLTGQRDDQDTPFSGRIHCRFTVGPPRYEGIRRIPVFVPASSPLIQQAGAGSFFAGSFLASSVPERTPGLR